MHDLSVDRVLEFLAGVEPVVGMVWIGLAALTITLLVLMRTRWGQSKPLRKCIVLSILAHLLLAGYATTVQIVSGSVPMKEPVLQISFIEDSAVDQPGDEAVDPQKPWEQFVHDQVVEPDVVPPERQEFEPELEPERQLDPTPMEIPVDRSLNHLSIAKADRPNPVIEPLVGATGRTDPAAASQKIEAPPAQRRDPEPLAIPTDAAPPQRQAVAAFSQPLEKKAAIAGVPDALLQQPLPLPQLAAPLTTHDPASALVAMNDQMTEPTRSRPAQPESIDKHPALSELTAPSATHSGNGGSRDRSTLIALRRHQGEMEAEMLARDSTVVVAPPSQPRETTEKMPEIYRLRTSPNRERAAQQHGATRESEAGVQAALRWLAANQRRDGRWDASDHGAGKEDLVSGRNRYRAGVEADTGITALALLAMLASGHTHQEGMYRDNVRRGLEYLLAEQASDGNLGGRATAYAKMYCHSMATFALSEAYGMTGDHRLRRPVRRAINYTLAAQDKSGGGWRYKPGDPGDTSQAGWQLMALKSAELAGIQIPVETKNNLIRYLRAAAGGQYGGLSSYRPSEPTSRPMTAEALTCWHFLGMPRSHPAGDEAGNYLLEELPGTGKPNFYYWYYGTLGMYHLGGDHWRRWNEAMQRTLLGLQQKDGRFAGSWNPDTVWGGYGGRVYSTAMATLSLEVYYRFLPMHVEAAPAERAE